MWSLLQVFLYLCLSILLFLIGLRLFFQPVTGVCRCQTNLHGKVALVTGGNSGIGLETARDLARRGARVIIASRNIKKSADAVKEIIETTGNPNVEYKYLDLSKFQSIRQFAKEFNKNEDRLDILVNNAGVSGVKNTMSEDNIDIVMQVNYFGQVLLTNCLLEKLTGSTPSRIINVSSNMHNIAFIKFGNLKCEKISPHWMRYANSKLCMILWTKELAMRLPTGVTTYSLHPGIVKTDIFLSLGYITSTILLLLIDLLFKTPEEGAQTIIHLCVAPGIERASGGYYKECRLYPASRQARRPELAEKVFSETMELIDVSGMK